MAKILITGSNGQLGRCLQDRASSFGFEFVAVDFNDLDITKQSEVVDFINRIQPAAIINAAAYTAVDKAEVEFDAAYNVNALGPKYLALMASKLNVPLFHVSTDYVFDGTGCEAYKPSDIPCPVGAYGKTKLAGENFVLEAHQKTAIIRTSWVFSEYGNNFVKTMLRLGKEREELGVIADQYGCPTYAGDLAQMLLSMLTIALEQDDWKGYGVHHFSGDEATSWHGFTRAILQLANRMEIINCLPKLNAIKTEDYPLPAPRPNYSVMDCSTLESLVAVNRNWKKSLAYVLARL
ncbi:dTDP-4-dehydrorhamnose reductase [Vibrio sp. CyArs1]|uniref:dTDP-4-dehydrorhamnose reductase n=1 Tax=Vibrio sp. CyArs1 TaxID=2682577 RepID=UPI001F056820|nr:dTDP-4-dehydrorhamnose reductase [Vibrio sp. CyArs1]